MDNSDAINHIDSIIDELTALKVFLAGQEADLPESAAGLMSQRICLYCKKKLGKASPVRGVHRACHRKAMRAIEKGPVTDKQLVSHGLLAPKTRGGRRKDPDDPIEKLVRESRDATADAVKNLKQHRKDDSS